MFRRLSFLVVLAAVMITGCGGDDKKEEKKSEKNGDGSKAVANNDSKVAGDEKDDDKDSNTAPKDNDVSPGKAGGGEPAGSNGGEAKKEEKKDEGTKGGDEKKDDAGSKGVAGGSGSEDKGDEKSELSVAELAQKFIEARDANDLQGALDALKPLSEKSPKHQLAFFYPFLLDQKTQQLLQAGEEKEAYANTLVAGAAFRKYKEARDDLNQRDKALGQGVIYNEACGYAKKNDVKKALESLEWSVDMGFANVNLFESDPDLNPLRKEEKYKALLVKVKASAEKAMEAARLQEEAQAKAELANIMKEMDEFETYPFKFALPNLEGNEVKLDDYKGKVLIVDIWGTWCPPCIKEIPHFIRLKNTYADKGFDIVGINYERGADGVVDKIKNFKEQHGINYTCVVGDNETRDQVPNFRGYPTTLFIDKKGNVRMQVVGYHAYPVLDGIVSRLLAEGGGEEKKEDAKPEAKKEEKAEEKKDEAKADEAKKEEVKKDEAKAEEAKKDEAKAEEAKADEGKKEEAKKEEVKKDEAKADEAKKEEGKK